MNFDWFVFINAWTIRNALIYYLRTKENEVNNGN